MCCTGRAVLGAAFVLLPNIGCQACVEIHCPTQLRAQLREQEQPHPPCPNGLLGVGTLLMKMASGHLLCQATSLFGSGVSWDPRRIRSGMAVSRSPESAIGAWGLSSLFSFYLPSSSAFGGHQPPEPSPFSPPSPWTVPRVHLPPQDSGQQHWPHRTRAKPDWSKLIPFPGTGF